MTNLVFGRVNHHAYLDLPITKPEGVGQNNLGKRTVKGVRLPLGAHFREPAIHCHMLHPVHRNQVVRIDTCGSGAGVMKIHSFWNVSFVSPVIHAVRFIHSRAIELRTIAMPILTSLPYPASRIGVHNVFDRRGGTTMTDCEPHVLPFDPSTAGPANLGTRNRLPTSTRAQTGTVRHVGNFDARTNRLCILSETFPARGFLTPWTAIRFVSVVKGFARQFLTACATREDRLLLWHFDPPSGSKRRRAGSDSQSLPGFSFPKLYQEWSLYA